MKNLYSNIIYVFIVLFLLSIPLSESGKNISLAILFLLLIYQFFTNKLLFPLDLINISIILHFFVVAIGIYIGIDSQESTKQIGDVFKILVTFLLFRNARLEFISFERIIQFLFIGFILVSILAILHSYTHGLNHIKLNSIGSINRSATYMVYIFTISLCLLTVYKNLYTKYLILGVFIISGILSILSGSRMAIFSLLPIILMYLIFTKRVSIENILLYSIPTIITILLVFMFLEDSRIIHKIQKGFNDVPRIQIWVSSFYIWLEHNILFGIGVGNSISFSTIEFYGMDALEKKPIDNAHNVYLDMLLERGIFGLTTFILFIYSLVTHNKGTKTIPSLVFLLSFALLLMGLANITFRYEFALLFVVVIGAYLNSSIRMYEKNSDS